jgi:hypothetical protein
MFLVLIYERNFESAERVLTDCMNWEGASEYDRLVALCWFVDMGMAVGDRADIDKILELMSWSNVLEGLQVIQLLD